MKIAFLTPEFVTEENYSGGLANYLRRVSLALANLGHKVEIFVLSDSNEIIEENGVKIIRVKQFKHFSNGLLKNIFYVMILFLNSHRLKNRLLKLHKIEKYDIVQCASYLAVGIALAKSKKVPVVTRVSSFQSALRSYSNIHTSVKSILAEGLEAVQLRDSAAVYAPTDNLINLIQSYEPVKIDVIKPEYFYEKVNFDYSIFEHTGLKNKKYFLYFGTMAEIKGVPFLFKNLEEILSLDDDINFVFIGKYGKESVIKNAAGKHFDRAHYIDSVKKNKLMPFIKEARAVILPSKLDNLPNTCMEAMAESKVVVTTNKTGFQKIIKHGQNGFLFDYGDKNGLIAILKSIIEMNDDQIINIGNNASKTISEEFSQENTKQLIAYFNNVITRWCE